MKKELVGIEDVLFDSVTHSAELREVPLSDRTLSWFGVAVTLVAFAVAGRIFFIGTDASAYEKQAVRNMTDERELMAPRGLIEDRYGTVLAENEPSYVVFVKIKELIANEAQAAEALGALNEILSLDIDEMWNVIRNASAHRYGNKVLVAGGVTQSQLIALEGREIPAIHIERGFRRTYAHGPVYSPIIGYTGMVNADDLTADPSLGYDAIVGRAGVEATYDAVVRGTSGYTSYFRNARGETFGESREEAPVIGSSLELTIDGDLQLYFYKRLQEGLESLGRRIGVGIAMNPNTGEVLSLVVIPSYDNNIFSSSANNAAIKKLLTSSDTPLFNRAISGRYSPGSTIKPLVALAALSENIITPEKTIFSPGYLDVPNPFNPEEPTRFLDWRYQGNVDVSSALAQSSNVYFYTVGGGHENIRGLGITKLKTWWEKFGLGARTGIDISGEADGFLPSPDEKQSRTGEPWRLGDTYNVSIGQGDLLITPIQLLNYINVIANGGYWNQPRVVRKDDVVPGRRILQEFQNHIQDVRRGMEEAVTSPLGTARILQSLAYSVAAKTGTAQMQNNKSENAFFVGYAPANNPEISILVLVENAKQGSINTVPIARDVLDWYYENRIKNISR